MKMTKIKINKWKTTFLQIKNEKKEGIFSCLANVESRFANFPQFPAVLIKNRPI
jgi:hypothetical protein